MARLFVYGTLRRGRLANRLLMSLGARFIGDAKTAPGYAIIRQHPYPAMVPMGRGQVGGELYEIPDSALSALDYYEGAPDFYRRAAIRLADGSEAIAYLLNAKEDV